VAGDQNTEAVSQVDGAARVSPAALSDGHSGYVPRPLLSHCAARVAGHQRASAFCAHPPGKIRRAAKNPDTVAHACCTGTRQVSQNDSQQVVRAQHSTRVQRPFSRAHACQTNEIWTNFNADPLPTATPVPPTATPEPTPFVYNLYAAYAAVCGTNPENYYQSTTSLPVFSLNTIANGGTYKIDKDTVPSGTDATLLQNLEDANYIVEILQLNESTTSTELLNNIISTATCE